MSKLWVEITMLDERLEMKKAATQTHQTTQLPFDLNLISSNPKTTYQPTNFNMVKITSVAIALMATISSATAASCPAPYDICGWALVNTYGKFLPF